MTSNIISFGDDLISGKYEFHSGFKNIDNFVNANGEFISLASNEAFHAANSIILSDFESNQYNQVTIAGNLAWLNQKEYELPAELQYSSDFKFPEISWVEIEDKVHSFIEAYDKMFPVKSLFFLICPQHKEHFISSFEKAFVLQMEEAFQLLTLDPLKSVLGFKSRGFGLTPSGDDFNAGVLMGINFLEFHQKSDVSEMKSTIYQHCLSNNLFSNNMLRLAYKGKYFQRMKAFLNAFFYLTLNDMEKPFKNILSIGSTSGADLMVGFLSVLLKKPVLQ